MIWDAVMYIAGLVSGAGAVLFLRRGKANPPTLEQVRKYMERVVNVEAIEEHEKLVKLRMMRQGLRNIRVDGGANAVVRRMRVTRRPR
jgi:hypothetical protein